MTGHADNLCISALFVKGQNAPTMQSAFGHVAGMAAENDSAREFLRSAVMAAGSAAALAKRAKISPSTITRPLNDPDFRFTPKLSTLQKISIASGVPLPGGLATAQIMAPVGDLLPVVGAVQAGAWLVIDDLAQEEPRRVPAARDTRFGADVRQYLLEVRGDSMNALTVDDRPWPIFEGDFVQCVCTDDFGYSPQTGHVIEFERTRDGGHLKEITLKQVEVTQRGIVLWPRSTNPRWQEPFRLQDGAVDDQEMVGRIRGLVIGVTRRFGL